MTFHLAVPGITQYGAIKSTDFTGSISFYVESFGYFPDLYVKINYLVMQPMLQELGKQNPELLGLIQDHHAEFLQLLNEPHDGSEG